MAFYACNIIHSKHPMLICCLECSYGSGLEIVLMSVSAGEPHTYAVSEDALYGAVVVWGGCSCVLSESAVTVCLLEDDGGVETPCQVVLCLHSQTLSAQSPLMDRGGMVVLFRLKSMISSLVYAVFRTRLFPETPSCQLLHLIPVGGLVPPQKWVPPQLCQQQIWQCCYWAGQEHSCGCRAGGSAHNRGRTRCWNWLLTRCGGLLSHSGSGPSGNPLSISMLVWYSQVWQFNHQSVWEDGVE